MTFKHSKFEDSPTMRSLEKIAVKHGLLTPEVRVKTASVAKPEYTPSSNLMENVIRLCAGLREKGLEKHANDLETKFLNYKRAFNAYETSKEKGEDLVDAAHPDGSHDLVGVDGDATIETIVDQHLKDMQVVDKKPSGKLASVKDIIGAVKVVLAQDVNIIKKNLDALKSNVASVMRIYHSENVIGRPMSFAGGDLVDFLNSVNEKTLDLNKAKEVQQSLADLRKVYSPGFLALSGVSQDAWNKMEPYFNSAQYEANEIVKELTNPAPQGRPLPGSAGPQELTSGFKEKVTAAVAKIRALTRSVERNDKPNLAKYKGPASKWLEGKLAQIAKLVNDFDKDSKSPGANQDALAKDYSQELVAITDKPGESLDNFKETWG